MELRDYLRILWRRRWLIALAIATAAGSALGFSSRIVPVYEASAKVFIGPRTVQSTDLNSAFAELTFGREFLASYAELLKSRPLAEKVVETENLSISGADLADRIETSIVTNTRIIKLSVTDTDPKRAQRVANALVNTFVDEDLQDFGGRAGVQANVLEPALEPTVPIKPKPVQNGLIGAVLGLVLGLSMAFLLEQFDTTLRTREDLERALAPLPVLATIPPVSGSERQLMLDLNSRTPASEAFRILRANVQFFAANEPVSKILIASPGTGEGKTTVAINLAVGFALAGVRTMLLECDLRKPVAHRYFVFKRAPGLSEVLLGDAPLSEALVPTRIPDLTVLPAGSPVPNPSELLGAQRIEQVIEKAQTLAPMLIFDSPPALAMSDAYVIAPQVDGVILVVRAGVTHRHRAKETKEAFERLGVRVLGVVWNAAETVGGYDYYRYYNDSRDSGPEPPPKKARGKAAAAPPKKTLESPRPVNQIASRVDQTMTPMVEVKQSAWDDLKMAPPPTPAVEVKQSPWDDLKVTLTPAPAVEVKDLSWDNPKPASRAPGQVDAIPVAPVVKEPSPAQKSRLKPPLTAPIRPSAPADQRAYHGYCMKCRSSREFDGTSTRLKGGRLAAQGACPVCGTKMTRMISEKTGKETASGPGS